MKFALDMCLTFFPYMMLTSAKCFFWICKIFKPLKNNEGNVAQIKVKQFWNP